jgi:diguanylate cyclase (GGDEF)-like protein
MKSNSIYKLRSTLARGITIVIISALLAASYYALTSLSENLRERESLHHAQAYLEAMDITRQYYADTIVPRAKLSNIPLSHHYAHSERALPVPATVSKELSARLNSAHKNYKFNIFSLHPFKNSLSNIELTPIQLKILQHFKNTQTASYSEVKTEAGLKTVYFAKPIRMQKQCVDCHNAHPDSRKRDWKVGDLRGASSVMRTSPPVLLWTDPALRWPVLSLLTAAVLAVGIVVVFLRHLTARNHLSQALKQNEELATARQEITALAYSDSLSGLANRRRFKKRLEEEHRKLTNRDSSGFSVILIDLYKFKSINDQYGHPVGDDVLRTVSTRIQEALDEGCFAARLGGDEFAVIVCSTASRMRARSVAERIAAVIERPMVCESANTSLELTPKCNLGFKTCTADREDSSTVLSDADLALYHSKTAGKTISEYCPSIRQVLVDKERFESEVRQAIDEDGFDIWIQPIINLQTLDVVEFEALVRWQHPSSRTVMPGELLPVISRLGLDEEFDFQIVRKALLLARELEARFGRKLRVNVNLSSQTCMSPAFLEKFKNALDVIDGDGSRLGIEITEHTIINDFEAINKNVRAMREHGTTVSLDDFGTGFSALSYLNRVEVDRIKIDRSFIDEMVRGARPMSLVRTICRLANDMDLDVIAEGIESSSQVVLLRKLGVEFGQGYLFAKPQPFTGNWPSITYANQMQSAVQTA